MADRKHVRRSRSQGYSQRSRPDDIYIRNPNVVPYSSVEELVLTPELLFDGEERENVTVSIRTESASTRNFFLEKPPANWKSEESPISPGVTMLLSPASCFDEEGADLDAMDFFQAATFSGPRTFAESTRLAPKPLNAEKKKSSRIDIPSPKTPKAWPSIEEPDISTLPSPETADRNLLEARLKLAGEITRKEALGSGNDECPQFDDLLQTYILVPRPIRGRNQRRSPYSSTKEITKSIEHVQSQSPSNEQRARSPSDGRDKSKNLHGKTTMLEPTSTNNLISRSPSPTFDFDDSEITDIESDTEFDETSNERLSRCETLSSQEPHSPLSDKPPKPLEKDWKFRFQRDCATGTLRTLESPSMHSSASQPPHELRRSKNRKFEGAGLSNYNVKYPTNYSQPIHTDRPRQMSAESRCSARSHIIPPPRKTSPPIIAPIHRDQMRERGASFEPESRTPRTLVANWLTSISSNAGRSREQQQQPPREHDVFWKKTRSWGRKSKPRLDGWI